MKRKGKESPIHLPRNLLLPLGGIGLITGLYALPHPTLMRIFYMVIAAIVLAKVYMVIIKKQLNFKVEAMNEVFIKGEQAEAKITVQNTSFLPSPYIYIFLKQSYHLVAQQTRCLCVTLPPHTSKTYCLNYVAELSGEEEIGIEQVMLIDYFELFRKKLDFSWSHQVKIKPQVVEMKEKEQSICFLPKKPKNKEMNCLRKNNEGEVSYELAPYQEGQSQRLIHWKLVAQRDIYMVREKEEVQQKCQERLVIIDPIILKGRDKVYLINKTLKGQRYRREIAQGKSLAELEDFRLTACISYLHKVIKQGETIRLWIYLENGWEQIHLKTREDLERISEKLGKAFRDKESFKDRRLPEIEDSNYSQQVVLSAGVDRELVSYVEKQADRLLLALQKEKLRYKGNRYATLSKDYEIQGSI